MPPSGGQIQSRCAWPVQSAFYGQDKSHPGIRYGPENAGSAHRQRPLIGNRGRIGDRDDFLRLSHPMKNSSAHYTPRPLDCAPPNMFTALSFRGRDCLSDGGRNAKPQLPFRTGPIENMLLWGLKRRVKAIASDGRGGDEAAERKRANTPSAFWMKVSLRCRFEPAANYAERHGGNAGAHGRICQQNRKISACCVHT